MNTIITIGRECGSGGREIGEKVAQYFNIDFYDKNLLNRASKDSGFCPEVFEHNDEKPINSLLYNLVMDTYSFGHSSTPFVDMPISHKVFLAQFDTIKRIAGEGPCVIVGRCADYALADLDNVLNIFIHADLDFRIGRISQRFSNMKDSEVRERIIKKDKERRNYYNYYSSKKWGMANSYDLSIDSSLLGIDGTVSMICNFVKEFECYAKNR